jgi:rhamnosyl/mannosyltransferase
MRVAHVYKDACPPVWGGIERYVADVAAATAARGVHVEVHVAGVRRPRTDRANGVDLHRYRETARVLSTPISAGLAVAAGRLEADVVHLHMPNPTGEIGALWNRRAGGLVATFHAPVVRQRFLEPAYGPVRARVLARCRVVLVSSAPMASARELARHRHTVHVLPYGVSPTLTHRPPTRRRRTGAGLRLLFVGRLVYYKRLDVLLSAVARCGDGPVALTIAGDGPLRPTLEKLVTELGIGHQVELAGAVDDRALRELYGAHDVFVMPSGSRAETFGMAMCEAMAAGLPAVSTSVGTGTDWVNVDGVTGVVVPPNDPARLAEAFRALARDRERVLQLGRNARERAAREFSFDRHVDELMSVYETVSRSEHSPCAP